MRKVKPDTEPSQNRPESRRKTLESALQKLRQAPPEIAQNLYRELRNAGCSHTEIYALLGENIACIRIDALPTSNSLTESIAKATPPKKSSRNRSRAGKP